MQLIPSSFTFAAANLDARLFLTGVSPRRLGVGLFSFCFLFGLGEFCLVTRSSAEMGRQAKF